MVDFTTRTISCPRFAIHDHLTAPAAESTI